VFANALTKVYPIFPAEDHFANYFTYIAVFAAIVVPLTLMGIHEQVKLQVILFLCRVLVVVVMVGTSLHAYTQAGNQPLDEALPVPMFDLSGISVVLPIATYAFLFTPQIPVIAEPVRDKRQLLSIFRTTVYACVVGYTSVAVFVSLLFGSHIFSSCNLHWATYTAGGYLASAGLFGKILIKSVSYYCLAFPALDVVSAFPLMAIGLGNNLAATCTCFSDEDTMSESEMSRRVMIFRLLATLPPIVGACFMSNLGAITSYTGISGCFLGFIFPPLLSLYSEHYFQIRQWNPLTVHSSPLSDYCRHAMIVFGVLLIGYVLGMTIASPMSAHDI
jgi:amino acid permease